MLFPQQSSNPVVKQQKGFTLSELLVSLAVLGLIAGLTVPSVIQATERGKQRGLLKESIQAISEIVQEGYLNADFAAITDWTIDSTTDPIVQYFTNNLGGITRQCATGNVTAPCNMRQGTAATSDATVAHAARWVMSNGTTLFMSGGNVGASSLTFVINTKPQANSGIGNQMAIICNIADTVRTAQYTGATPLKPAQCGPFWAATTNSFYTLTFEQLYS